MTLAVGVVALTAALWTLIVGIQTLTEGRVPSPRQCGQAVVLAVAWWVAAALLIGAAMLIAVGLREVFP